MLHLISIETATRIQRCVSLRHPAHLGILSITYQPQSLLFLTSYRHQTSDILCAWYFTIPSLSLTICTCGFQPYAQLFSHQSKPMYTSNQRIILSISHHVVPVLRRKDFRPMVSRFMKAVFAISENSPCLKYILNSFAELEPKSPMCLSFPIITGGDAICSHYCCAESSHWSYARDALGKMPLPFQRCRLPLFNFNWFRW